MFRVVADDQSEFENQSYAVRGYQSLPACIFCAKLIAASEKQKSHLAVWIFPFTIFFCVCGCVREEVVLLHV